MLDRGGLVPKSSQATQRLSVRAFIRNVSIQKGPKLAELLRVPQDRSQRERERSDKRERERWKQGEREVVTRRRLQWPPQTSEV